MNENVTNAISRTDWARIDALTEDEIDTSDIPPLPEAFFANAKWQMPSEEVTVTVPVDRDTLAWFKAQGKTYRRRMMAALRIYAEAHKVAA
jgi:uncharacterized protein (DUF4415 family)